MKHPSPAFPITVVLIEATGGLLSEDVLQALCETLAKLSDASPGGGWLVHLGGDDSNPQLREHTEALGFKYRPVQAGESREHGRKSITLAAIDLLDTSEAAIVISHPAAAKDIVNYARRTGQPFIHIYPTGAACDGAVPERLESQSGWLPDLFAAAGLSPDSSLQTIQRRMDELANRTAPVTRARWNWIVALQGLAVCAPIAWLIQRSIDLPVQLAGTLMLATAALLGSVIWTLRYRSMQKTWARARLVAETARSLTATADCPHHLTWRGLATVPSLRPLRWMIADVPKASFSEWRDRYLNSRIDDQHRYFTQKQQESEAQRKRLSRWTTLMLDLALCFALGGTIVALTPAPGGKGWLDLLGGEWAEVVLGVGGAIAALAVVLIQILRAVQELNRRTARYAQQRQLLEHARLRLSSIDSAAAALQMVQDTEEKLLAEVLEWYFHAETAEHFIEFRAKRGEILPRRVAPKSLDTPASHLIRLVGRRIGLAGQFLLWVLLGRLPWIVGSVAATVAWIAFNVATHPAQTNQTGPELLDKTGLPGHLFDPQPQQARHGCVVLVHGLYGSASWEKKDDPRNWMEPCASAISERMKQSGEPAICLVDWTNLAKPSKHFRLGLGEKNFLGDIPAIRGQAYEVGELVARKLGRLIVANRLYKDCPFHLIGHSAGGFVVARVAMRLSELGLLPPDCVRVTILDTPEADDPILLELPNTCATDFCITSDKVWPRLFNRVNQLDRK